MNAFDPSITHSPLLVEHGPGAGGAGVAAAVGLGEAEGAEGAAGDEVGQPSRLLVVVAEAVKIGLAPRPTPADSVMPSDWSTRPISSMATHSEVKSPSAPPYSLGEHQPEQAELAHRPHDVDREDVIPVPGCAACGAISASAKSRTDLAERLVLVGQLPCHRTTPSLLVPCSFTHGVDLDQQLIQRDRMYPP